MAGPRVSVGMPVHNGAQFVAEAVEGVLAQDYDDLELIISDNASTDSTVEICRRYAERDPRIRLLTCQVNRGLAWNYNRVFAASEAEFFMWNAADDVRLPTMVSRCVEALDATPGTVLAYPRVIYIDEHGDEFRTWPATRRATADRASTRFGDVAANERECFPLHGVIRMSALRDTALHGGYPGSDRPLLAELALRGRFVELDEALFMRRDHADRSMRRFRTARERNAFFDPRRATTITLPRWRLGAEYVRAVARAPVPASERVRALGYMALWVRRSWRPLGRNLGSAAVALLRRTVSRRSTQRSRHE